MFRIEKKGVFPFIGCGLFDPEGLGAGTRLPLVPQEVARLQRRSFYLRGEYGKLAFKSNNHLERFLQILLLLEESRIPTIRDFSGY
ncbi:hypothetical protein ACQCVP_04855 [Rossellomorea vietnamensis]|uniref:hypothetical protein n=1 Tax=Rossellomorea vietnamensis TaxID=218284 RepID=UPI003CEA80DD